METSGANSRPRFAEGAFGGDEAAAFEGETGTAGTDGVVEVGKRAGGVVAEDVGEVELAVAVVAAAEDGGKQGVADSGFEGACALAKEAGILMEEDGVDGSGEHGAVDDVEVVGADAFEVSFGTPMVAAVGVFNFGNAGEEEGADDVEGGRARRGRRGGFSGAG